MAWATSANVIQTNLSAGTDDPSLARANLYTALGELILVIDGRGTANGVASLDSNAQVPAGQIPNTLTSTIGNNLILSPDTTRVAIQDILNLNPLTVSELNSLTGIEGDTAYCSNGDAGGECIAVYNGSDWKVIAFGATISSS